MKIIKTLICFSLLLSSCDFSNNNKIRDYDAWKLKYDNRTQELAKEYNINYLLDTVDIKYSIESEKLLKEDALMIRSGVIQDLIKRNDSTYLIRSEVYPFYIDIKTDKKEIIEKILNKKGSENSFLIFRLDKVQKIAINLHVYSTMNDHSEVENARDYLEIEATGSDSFFAEGELIYYEYMEY
jgi:hypothetical protein